MNLGLEPVFLGSLFEVHAPVVELAAVRVPRPLALAPGPVLELAGVCPHPHLEVVQLPLLLLAQHAVRLVHLTHALLLLLAAQVSGTCGYLHILLVYQLPVKLINTEVFIRMQLLKDTGGVSDI